MYLCVCVWRGGFRKVIKICNRVEYFFEICKLEEIIRGFEVVFFRRSEGFREGRE